MKFAVYLLLLCCLFEVRVAKANPGQSDFVGSQQCAACHTVQAEDWKSSHHYQSMLPASADTALGDFTNASYKDSERSARFFERENGLFIETQNERGELTSYPVRYTFGFYPLQQYLLETDGGKLQAFDIAWDSRTAEEGGQRWYPLQSDAVGDPEHPFFWTGHFQNWNSRCAACHSTNVSKHFDPKTLRFNTTFSEVNVGCEACHGPGDTHVQRAKKGSLTQLGSGLIPLQAAPVFQFREGDPIARLAEVSADHANSTASRSDFKQKLALDTCGGCHSRRSELIEAKPGLDYHDNFDLQDIREPFYFSDGAIQDEVFVLGSFLQSKMAQAGVSCTNCHNPHSGETILPGAQVCATCHQSDVFASNTHTNGHKGMADCLDCHMPARTYMGVDARRDHQFHRPSALSLRGVETCRDCHNDKNTKWLMAALKQWPKRKGASQHDMAKWAHLNELPSRNSAAYSKAIELLDSDALAPVLKASILNSFANFPSQDHSQFVKSASRSDSPIMRKAAVEAAENTTPELAKDIFLALRDDSSKVVRMSVAAAIVAAPKGHYGKEVEYQKLISEYEQSLQSNRDHPGANNALAQIALYSVDSNAAGEYYKTSLAIDPSDITALINYSELKRAVGDSIASVKLLESALGYWPDSAAVQHAYGLHWVRQKQLSKALQHLKVASNAEDATSRYALVYAVAQWQQANQKQAIDTLQKANARWPAQYQIINTWLRYALQMRDMPSARIAAKAMLAHFPDDPLLAQLQPYLQQ